MSKKYSDLRPSGESTKYVRCYETHPELKIGEARVFGGSAHTPMVKDADIYVGVDSMMAYEDKAWPWVPGEAILFPIKDMQPPQNPKQFKQMIAYLKERCKEPIKIHIGCMGGHGRTGMVLSALVKEVMGEEDAITWVRTHYCKKVVETTSQVDFLHQHFGIKKVKGSKTGDGSGAPMHALGGWKGADNSVPWGGSGDYGTSSASFSTAGQSFKRSAVEVKPVNGKGSIWS